MLLFDLVLDCILYKWVIDQVWGQDGRILAEFLFYIFMDQDVVEVHKNAKKERG